MRCVTVTMNSLDRQGRKSRGAHYTPAVLAHHVAHQIVSQCRGDSARPIRVLDPAVGDGELLSALLGQLDARSVEAAGYDTDIMALHSARRSLTASFPRFQIQLKRQDFLKVALNVGPSTPSLFFSGTRTRLEPFDMVIANPPYVRTQVLGAAKSQALTQDFGLNGRVDLYQAFIKGIAQVLKPGGIAGIIVSNRFMTTRSGISTRTGILDNFEILHIWDLGDTELFEAAVLPAVLLLRRKSIGSGHGKSNFSSVYKSKARAEGSSAANAIDALRFRGVVRTHSGEVLEVRHGLLDFGRDSSSVWRLSTPSGDDWLDTVGRFTYCTFGDVGKVRVGVKTTADNVFIRENWDIDGEIGTPEALRPLTTHHIARRYRALEEAPKRQILYTHETVNGRRRAINLAKLPNTLRYLERHRGILESRSYVRAAGRSWYEIWVPQDPSAWSKPKVVFRDIAEQPTFWMDLAGTVVNGDCYWLKVDDPGAENQADILWLIVAIANSPFIEEFYDHRFHNKLYSGRRRFMTQYVEAFPLPNPTSQISRRLIEAAKRVYALLPDAKAAAVEKEIQGLVYESFGFTRYAARESRPAGESEAFYLGPCPRNA
ncbi:MAG TPA: N-6 DNA methylase [Candidatus Aquilonibacter sp.]|nr:N-6 DNA methylase [Candidatus Aquilonibacter sp.]